MTEEVQTVLDDDGIALIEALIFASGEPLSKEDLSRVSGLDEEEIDLGIERLRARYGAGDFGFELVQVGGSYQLRTKPRFAAFLRELKSEKPRRLSAAALETLAIVAYRQPIVRSDMEKIRGVDVSPTLKTLIERNLVRIVGHQSTVGQPALYGTTDEFLKVFGLNSLAELPSLRDLAELEREPGEEQGEEPEAPAEESPADPAAQASEAQGQEADSAQPLQPQ